MASILFSLLGISVFVAVIRAAAVTEGDTAYDPYDYDGAYDDDSVESSGEEPSFDVPILNVTVVAGQTAVLPCSIDNLGTYQVIWIGGYSITLTHEGRRVVDDPRYDIIRPYPREWNLQIRDVTWEDGGPYRCTINTSPVKKKVVTLHVKVPAKIIEEYSSKNVNVDEGDSVRLHCNVTGVPRPEVTWFRQPADDENAEPVGLDKVGETILIKNVTRNCDDYYECVASNGVPPAKHYRIRVTVRFPPEVKVRNKRIGQELGKTTYLECEVDAFPQSSNIWYHNGRPRKSKTEVNVYEEGTNKLTLSLKIPNIEASDYGTYTCVGSNKLGRANASTELYEYIPPEPVATINNHNLGNDGKTIEPIIITHRSDDNHPNTKQPASGHHYQPVRPNSPASQGSGSENTGQSVQEPSSDGVSHYMTRSTTALLLLVWIGRSAT